MMLLQKQKCLIDLGGVKMEKVIEVMVAGLPGKMASLVAKYIKEAEKDMELMLMPFALAETDGESQIGGMPVVHIPLADRIDKIKELSPDIIVDFTLPDSVNRNAQVYCHCEIPFVMGTTGGNRDELIQTVKDSKVSAVIAPNMAKQVVGFQAMMEYAANQFPGLFAGYNLEITESHQQGKKDTSGTAKAIVGYFNKLGIPFDPSQIEMIRNPDAQRAMGVPEEALGGHGWHTYELVSDDKTVNLKFVHNINGRDVYARGTLDAIRFLARKIQGGSKGEVFSMIDVLKGI